MDQVNFFKCLSDDPCVIQNAAYMPPTLAGFSIEMKQASIEKYRFKG